MTWNPDQAGGGFAASEPRGEIPSVARDLFRENLCVDGERGWIRTSDPRLKRALLYQLSYAPTLF